MSRWIPISGAIVALLAVVLYTAAFKVDERKQGLVLQFGQVVRIADEPGLYFKVPLIQEVAFYEDRILPVETSELEVTPADERRLVVDAFARWRIADIVRFRQSVGDERRARQRLSQILNDSLRQVLGSVPQADVLSPERQVLMTRIRDVARGQALAFGVEVVDVRIRRADLPAQNLQATFDRMQAERAREAADERARGRERAQEVRATADREATELVSDAQRRAEVIRGEADAERNRVFAEAFSRDPEFFAFYRSLTAYERALTGNNSTMVMAPNSEFFDYLRSDARVPVDPTLATTVSVAAPVPAGEGDGDASTATEEALQAAEPVDPEAVAPSEDDTGQAEPETVE
ncbi:MAG: protease modulator HflC [Pseudomonadota bacterium]